MSHDGNQNDGLGLKRLWANLCNSLAESVLEMPDEDVLQMAREDGEDPLAAAARARSVLQAADRSHRQRELALAAERHRRTVARLQRRQYRLPQGREAQRAWLLSLLRNNPALGSGLTLQHRSFSEISDSEVEGYLKQLIELGVADDEGRASQGGPQSPSDPSFGDDSKGEN